MSQDEEKLDYVPRVGQTVKPQAGAVVTRRQIAERAAFDAEPEEKVVRPYRAHPSLKEYQEQEVAIRPTSSLVNHFAEVENRRRAASDAREAADIASGKLTIVTDKTVEREWRKQQEAKQEAVRRTAQEREAKAAAFQIDLALGNASPSEVKTVKLLLARKYPSGATYEQAATELFKLREAVGIPGSTQPDWSKKLV
jgi:hypothetical protein